MTILETIARRRSVRSFDGRPLPPEARSRIQTLMEQSRNPYGLPVRFALLDGREQGLSSLVISGAELWIAGKLRRTPHAVRVGDTVHFYEKHSRGYVDKSGWDLQKIDLGIALAHFSLAAGALGLQTRFTAADPGLAPPAGTEYIAGYRLE